MAWVRYDDNFDGNPKVTAVVHDDVAALSLHLLANTWTNRQKRPGHIPAHQPAVLLCDKRKAARWAGVLVRHGLWHVRGKECSECAEEYAGLPADATGYVIHNAREYRPPARERTTPGTPSDLSEKRRAAGRAGGRASAAKREQAKQRGQAEQANGVSKGSNLLPAGVSPVPVPVPVEPSLPTEGLFDAPASKPAESPRPAHPQREPKPETENQRVNRVTKIYTDEVKLSPFGAVQQIVKRALQCGDYTEEQVIAGLRDLVRERSTVTANILRHAIEKTSPFPVNARAPTSGSDIAVRNHQPPRPSTAALRMQQGLEVAAELDREYAAGGNP